MKTEDFGLLLDLIKELRAAGSWTGKTHIIKTLYLATECAGIEAPFEFILYKHGPYSFDVEDALAAMQVYGYTAQEDLAPGYGRTFVEGPKASALLRAAALPPSQKTKIRRICRAVGTKNVRELEGLATACWVKCREGITETERIAERINALKPHIPLEEARSRTKELGALMAV